MKDINVKVSVCVKKAQNARLLGINDRHGRDRSVLQ